jgi:hypothetical protein
MRNNTAVLIICVLALLLIAPVAKAGDTQTETKAASTNEEGVTRSAANKVHWHVIASGGSLASLGSMQLGSTIGQTAAGFSSMGSMDLNCGYWQNFESGAGPCCMNGTTGNVTYDQLDEVDIADLTRMVNFLFVTFEPLACPAEGNVTGDENCEVDIADLTRMVNYLFVTFEPLAACLPQCE